MNIPCSDFIARIKGDTTATTPIMVPAPAVHIFDHAWFKDEFWPVWCRIKREYRQQHNQPLENNAKRGTCDEIAKRMVSYLIEAARKLNGDANIGAGATEVNIFIPAGYALNKVPGFGGHRTVVIGLTSDGVTWAPWYAEQQLNEFNYEETTLDNATAAGVVLVDILL